MFGFIRYGEHARSAIQRRRRGLSTLEFCGCVIAVLGGAWIGALYLGVNPQHLAHSALEQAHLLEKVPPDWRPQGPKDDTVTREELVSTLRKEFGSLRSEIVALHSGGEPAAAQANPGVSSGAKANTRTYWKRLNDIALSEDDLQRDAETAIDDTNVAKVFAVKSRVSHFAAKSVEALPTEGVDEQVLKFGRQLGVWYRHGGELYEQAVAIWETPTGQQARTRLTEQWKRAERQHSHEARLLRERAAVLRASVGRQLGEEFPEFAKPAAETAPEPTAAPAEAPSESPAPPSGQSVGTEAAVQAG